MLGGKVAAARRTAGLHIGRPALLRRHRVERTAASEELTFEMYRMDLPMIRVNAACAVLNHRVRLPGIKQLIDEVHVLVGHGVACVARRQRVHSEILGGQVLAAGHDVPAEAPAGDVIDRA